MNKGAQLARRWCASCHAIGGNPTGPLPQGSPSFQITARSGMTADQLRASLPHHGAMPNQALTRVEIEYLISDIEMLR